MTPGVGLVLLLDKSLRSQAFQSNNYLNDNEQNSGGGALTLKGWRSTQPEHDYCVIF